MTGPKKIEGYECLDGRVLPEKRDAIIADICFLVIKYANEHNRDVNSYFCLGNRMKSSMARLRDQPEVMKEIVGSMLEQEMDIVVHWISNNMELLEMMMAYFVEANIDKE